MKVEKTHMIFLLVLVGLSCVAGGGSVESMSEGDYTKAVGEQAAQKALIGQNPATWGPPLKRKHHGGGRHGGGGEQPAGGGGQPGGGQMLRVILVGLLLAFIAFLLM